MQDWGTDEETLKKKEGKQNQIHKGGKADKGHMKNKGTTGFLRICRSHASHLLSMREASQCILVEALA